MVLLASVCSLAARAAGDATLIDAVKNRNVDEVRALLKQRVDVDAAQGDGATALHWASHLDDLTAADLLIRGGADVNAATDLGVTPLYLACTNRAARMVGRLLTAGANPNAVLLNGETVLMECSRTGDLDAVKALLARGANVNARSSSHEQTALMWAAAQQHPSVVEVLIAHGADVRARSSIYVSTVTSEGQGLEKRKDPADLNYTVTRGGSTPLLFAARSGDVESAKLLLAAGADVNDALPDGTSALTLAAHSGHEALGTLLVEKGADRNATAVGYTPLHAAVLRGQLGLVQALLVRGANPNAPITAGTPIRRSSQDFALPKSLVGATPYFLAARFLEVAMMRALAAGGADPNLGLPDGTTPLMAAAGAGASLSADRRGLGHRRWRRTARAGESRRRCRTGRNRFGRRRHRREPGRQYRPAQRGLPRIRPGRAAPRRQERCRQREEHTRTNAAGDVDGAGRCGRQRRVLTRGGRVPEHRGAAAQAGRDRVGAVCRMDGILAKQCVQPRLACSVGVSPTGGKVRNLRSLGRIRGGNEADEADRQSHLRDGERVTGPQRK